MAREFDTQIDLLEQASPANPAAGFLRLFPKSDHKLYTRDSTGAEVDLTATGAGGATAFVTIAKWGTD